MPYYSTGNYSYHFDEEEDEEDEEEEDGYYDEYYDDNNEGDYDDYYYDEEEDEDEEVFFMHYSSYQRTLLVGEGDFSFSLSLAASLGSGSNLVATSFESREEVEETYSNADDNIAALEELGCTVYFGVDATEMSEYEIFSEESFDRIIYNFPHAGFHAPERFQYQIKDLIGGFLANARDMLDADGEIHVTHRVDYPYSRWNSIGLARCVGLVHCGTTIFRAEDYDGYCPRRGQGPFSSGTFPTDPSSTFKFRLL